MKYQSLFSRKKLEKYFKISTAEFLTQHAFFLIPRGKDLNKMWLNSLLVSVSGCTCRNYSHKYRACLYYKSKPYLPQEFRNNTLSRETTLLVCVEVLRPSQPNGVMLSAVSLPNHTFTGQA